jgi:hypothetical protein
MGAVLRAGPSTFQLNRGRLRFARGRAYMPAMDRDYWTKELREAEAELAAAKRRTELNAAAKRLQRAKTELKRLEAVQWPSGRSGALTLVPARRSLPEHLVLFVDLEPRLLQVLYDPLGEHLAGIVRRVFRQEPSHQATTTRDREADRKSELIAKGAVIHVGDVLALF